MNNSIEDIWDTICSSLEILEDKEKKDLIREYGRRVARRTCEQVAKEIMVVGEAYSRPIHKEVVDQLQQLYIE